MIGALLVLNALLATFAVTPVTRTASATNVGGATRTEPGAGRLGLPGATGTPTPTSAPVTRTPGPTGPAPSPKARCNAATLVGGQPAPLRVTAGQPFTATWRVQNNGTCAWTEDYALVWVAGERLGSRAPLALGTLVAPGEMQRLQAALIAPGEAGHFRGEWKLRDAAGQLFGLGEQGDGPLSLRITVVRAESLTVPASPIPTATSSPVPPSETPSATPTASATATESVAPSATSTSSPTTSATLAPAQVAGRLLVHGTPAGAGTVVTIEDVGGQVWASQPVDAQGAFTFGALAVPAGDYQVVFAQAFNEHYSSEQVISWGWIGPIRLQAGAQVALGDFEVGLQGLAHVQPVPDGTQSAAAITSVTPLVFDWAAYPGASGHWVDLTAGDDQSLVWQSALLSGTNVSFDGLLSSGARISPGQYRWAVGAQWPAGAYSVVAYGYLATLTIVP